MAPAISMEVVHRSEEEDIAPLSVSGVWRSVAVQLVVPRCRSFFWFWSLEK
jgi:hydrogenase maturation factor